MFGEQTPRYGRDRVSSAAAREAQRRAARRAVIKAGHPDIGGDADAFVAALAQVERTHGVDVPGRRAVSRRRRLRQNVRRLRGALPRSMPGRVRYIDITSCPRPGETAARNAEEESREHGTRWENA